MNNDGKFSGKLGGQGEGEGDGGSSQLHVSTSQN